MVRYIQNTSTYQYIQTLYGNIWTNQRVDVLQLDDSVLHQQSGQHVQTLRGHLSSIQTYCDISNTVNNKIRKDLITV